MKKFRLLNYPWKSNIDYRKHPEKYIIGRGEQGVLICEPYRSELLPFWKFKTPSQARKSANRIYKMFLFYLRKEEFVGADLARKFLQMGYTRSKRYANYKGGKKYAANKRITLPRGTGDKNKLESAHIFYEKWRLAVNNQKYKELKKHWRYRSKITSQL